MLRIVLALAIANTLALAVIGIFVVHGAVRSGCAEARSQASLGWLAVALARTDPASAGAAAALAAGDYIRATELSDPDLWSTDDATRVAALGRMRADVAGIRDLAQQATHRAIAICE